jgi:hypothetical protein
MDCIFCDLAPRLFSKPSDIFLLTHSLKSDDSFFISCLSDIVKNEKWWNTNSDLTAMFDSLLKEHEDISVGIFHKNAWDTPLVES